MTVGELKKRLESFPDDMLVIAYDLGGYPDDDVEPRLETIRADDRYLSWLPGRTVCWIA